MPWNDWIRTVEVEPSLYAADFARLGEQIDTLMRAGVRIFHFDVGDGHFVEPITLGPIVLQSISEQIHRLDGVIDCHLMTEDPEKHFKAFAAAGGDSVTVHIEACDDLHAVTQAARAEGLQVGMAFKPETDATDAAQAAVVAGVDLVLCMSIEPGYSGQPFMPEAIGRIRAARAILPDEIPIQVDGGIGQDNIADVYIAGARLFVAGTSIFGMEDLPRAYRRLLQALT
ncbi:MAG: ribulose-phosphate 3-epimerase [Gaiellaceae bacterium]